jgi:hypothetical protein
VIGFLPKKRCTAPPRHAHNHSARGQPTLHEGAYREDATQNFRTVSFTSSARGCDINMDPLLNIRSPANHTKTSGGSHDASRTARCSADVALQGSLDDEQSQPARVSLAYLEQCTDKFSVERRLGQGAFGLVYEGVDPTNGLVFGVKHLVRGEAMLRSAQREIQVLSRFRHPHIVRLLGYTPPAADGDPPCLVYELAKKGALDKALHDDTVAGELTWRMRVRVALGLTKALNYLHCGGYGETCFHRDVKAANVCLTADLSPKLIDCGLAMYVPDSGGSHEGRTMLTASGGALGTYQLHRRREHRKPHRQDDDDAPIFDDASEVY